MTATATIPKNLPLADARRWPAVRTVACAVRALPSTAPALARPVLDARGRAGLVVELPDIYTDTAELARRCLRAAVRSADVRSEGLCEGGQSGGDRSGGDPSEGHPRRYDGSHTGPMPAAVAQLLEGIAAAPGVALSLAHATQAVARAGVHSFVLRWSAGTTALLSIALPRLCDVPPAALAPLRSFAALAGADVRLARLDVGDDWCGYSVALPLEPLAGTDGARLLAAVWMSCHALVALERALPPLATLVDPGFRPLLQLAGPDPSVPDRPVPHRRKP